MHELAIIQGIIEQIETEKKKNNFSKVNLIEIVCGKFNCASEDNLQFCLDAFAKGTYIEGAVLKLTRLEDKKSLFYLNTLEVD